MHTSFIGSLIRVSTFSRKLTGIWMCRRVSVSPRCSLTNIDVFSGRVGNAKYVWEVNRMQFLLHLAYTYETSKDLKYLVLFCPLYRHLEGIEPLYARCELVQ
jgi:hypothetical protein